MKMDREVYAWKNFDLNNELHIAANFIYTGLVSLSSLDENPHGDEVFRVFYDLSVGVERLLKITITLYSDYNENDQDEFEKSLKHHSHSNLSKMLEGLAPSYQPSSDDLRVLDQLCRFYNHYRYDRYTLESVYDRDKEAALLENLIGNGQQKGIRAVLKQFCVSLYKMIELSAREKSLYTYEIRYGSKADKLFQRAETDFLNEEVALKEFILALAHGQNNEKLVELAASIGGPLTFESSDMDECFDAFFDHSVKMDLIDLVQHLYEEGDYKPSKRIELLKHLDSRLLWSSYDDSDEDDEIENLE